MIIFYYILIGLFSGFVGGSLGLGGGAVMVPAMVYFFGLTQHQAQGTSLAVMLPPVFLLATMKYYSEGNVKVQMAIYMAVGLFVGAMLGAHFVQNIPASTLKKVFGVFLMLTGLKMILVK